MSLFWTVFLHRLSSVISVEQTVFVQYFVCVVFLSSLCILSFRLLMSVPLKGKCISGCRLYSGFCMTVLDLIFSHPYSSALCTVM